MIFPIEDLKIFSAPELGLLFGNADEDWSRESEYSRSASLELRRILG